ncbi:MAG: S16 family serine protease, partial [Ignavibacteriaceae bacterium]
AKRNKIETVLIPKENEIDLNEISDEVKEGLKIIPIEKVADAIPYVFPKVKRKKSSSKTIKKVTKKK